jgi:predicted DNA binding CopG/RHH family protein
MKNKIKYTDGPKGRLKAVKDFLPPPEQLALKEESVKITLSLNKKSVAFLKKKALERRTSYQQMIRQIVDLYASHYQRNN